MVLSVLCFPSSQAHFPHSRHTPHSDAPHAPHAAPESSGSRTRGVEGGTLTDELWQQWEQNNIVDSNQKEKVKSEKKNKKK